MRPIISSFDPCLQALEDVDSAATAVSSERGNVANADLGGLVRVRGGALRDALGAGAALLQDVTAAELAVKGALRVGGVALHGHTVRGSNERGSSGGENNESLDHVERSVGEVCEPFTIAILYPSSGFFDFFFIDTFICSSRRRTREESYGIGSNVSGARRMVHNTKE